MAIYVVKIELPYEDETRLGIYFATTGTMATVTFGGEEEISARMFAREYEDRNFAEREGFSEAAYERLQTDLRAFLDATFPSHRENNPDLPTGWQVHLNPKGNRVGQIPDEGNDEVLFDKVALIEWYRDNSWQSHETQHKFHMWKIARELRGKDRIAGPSAPPA